jgi:uncharacterized lipoprotein YbaY
VVIPPDGPEGEAIRIVIEVRDVSLADAPSRVVAQEQLEHVAVHPNDRLAFALEVPESEPSAALSLRVHVDMDGSGRVSRGDLLTTSSQPVPPVGDARHLVVRVRKV